MLFAEFWTFSLFCALALSKAGARVVMPTLFCSSENTNRTCEDILEDEIPSPPCPDAGMQLVYAYRWHVGIANSYFTGHAI
ncbi:hypothetical protein GBAR_LOCUS1731 [Geodia barretti]|uniref:Secreted protein n=1 Tax=Geodia barretti TaxID=519541 RepID=A0AA35QX77_GEOBA|nr:hypothetical protein GBAR_LOCUS1731 [Geodia barretti]